MSAKIPPPDRFWEALPTKIEEGRVIPVIGPELVQVALAARTESLECAIARRLADQSGVAPEGEDGSISLLVSSAMSSSGFFLLIAGFLLPRSVELPC
jgi:hypothetical protein